MPWSRFIANARAEALVSGLSDPAEQPKFENDVKNALDPDFIYDSAKGNLKVAVGEAVQQTGLVDANGDLLDTRVWGYGTNQSGYTWPGRTFEVRSYVPLEVKWENKLDRNKVQYLMTGKDNTGDGFGDYTGRPVYDKNLHWAQCR